MLVIDGFERLVGRLMSNMPIRMLGLVMTNIPIGMLEVEMTNILIIIMEFVLVITIMIRIPAFTIRWTNMMSNQVMELVISEFSMRNKVFIISFV